MWTRDHQRRQLYRRVVPASPVPVVHVGSSLVLRKENMHIEGRLKYEVFVC